MNRKKTTTIKPLAVVTGEERADYARRMALASNKQLEAVAAASYLDKLGEELRERYDLPAAYNIDLNTGHVTPVTVDG